MKNISRVHTHHQNMPPTLLTGFRPLTSLYVIHVRVHNCSLTQGTGPRRAPLQWGGWRGPHPPPWAAWWPGGGVSPGGRWPVWVRRTSWAGWWCAGRCGDTPAWLPPWRPPWSWPGSCREGPGRDVHNVIIFIIIFMRCVNLLEIQEN